MFVDAAGLRCRNPAILSHTVQRQRGLEAIAENGHVLSIGGRMFRPEGKPFVDFDRVGKSRASVFPGFCSKHDSETFKGVEGKTFIANKSSLLMLPYRVICLELAKKEEVVGLYTDPNLLNALELEGQREVEGFLAGARLAITDLRREKIDHERALHGGDLSAFEGVVFSLSAPLPFCCASSISPEYDAFGERMLPEFNEEWNSISWFSGRIGDRDIFALCGFTNRRNQNIKGFFESLRSVDLRATGDVALNFSVIYAENSYYRESWVNALTPDQKQWMLSTFRTIVPGDLESGVRSAFESQGLVNIGATEAQFV